MFHVFQSTPSVKRETMLAKFSLNCHLISIHSLCEEGDVLSVSLWIARCISIHSLCEEGDYWRLSCQRSTLYSIHSLCEEGDIDGIEIKEREQTFQSTPSVKRETKLGCVMFSVQCYFNPLPLWRGRLIQCCHLSSRLDFNPLPLWRGRPRRLSATSRRNKISIHSLCEEGDTISVIFATSLSSISIHSLCEEGDAHRFKSSSRNSISIHSLCEEGDQLIHIVYLCFTYFNPLPLWRGRLCSLNSALTVILFQSTPSVKRETFCRCLSELHVAFQSTPSVKRETIDDYLVSVQLCIQSTPSVKRETLTVSKSKRESKHFNPLPLWRGRLSISITPAKITLFQSTPSVKRETQVPIIAIAGGKDFNPLPLWRGRPTTTDHTTTTDTISIHSLCEEGDVNSEPRWKMFVKFQSTPSVKRETPW